MTFFQPYFLIALWNKVLYVLGYFLFFDLNVKEKTNPFKYYTQPHEVDAQIFGFNRLAKLSKRPFETIVRNWFDKNKDIHKLNKNETQKVINIILTQNNEKSS